MSEKQPTKASPGKPSVNKNIKKLRTISVVCSLASSWQQWATENEEKLAREPTGWCPSSLEGPEEPKKTWIPKKTPSAQPSETSTNLRLAKTTDASGPERSESPDSPIVTSKIKTVQVVKTVSSTAKEKCSGVGLLAEKMAKDPLPSGEEIDKLLKKKSSPTRRRKCSNVVASLTQSWRKVEKEGKEDGRSEEDGKADDEGRTSRTSFSEEEDPKCEEEFQTAVRIKRPSVSAYKKEAEDANKINALSKKCSAVGSLKSRWQDWASEHTVNQRLNPFSEYFDYDYSMSLRLQKGEEGYGRPKEGTKTAERAKRAERHIHREIDDMCYVIRTMADPDDDGKTRITFGALFDRYVRISDKVVGILMRARKHGKVAFEGEMLWQGQDDGVIITLLV